MNIQECISLICETNHWIYEGSYVLQHPFTPASCGGGGGHRERRYEFSFEGNTISFNTRGVRARARVAMFL